MLDRLQATKNAQVEAKSAVLASTQKALRTVYPGRTATEKTAVQTPPAESPATPLTPSGTEYWTQAGIPSDTAIGQSTQKVLQSQVDGSAFDPFASQQREAQARAEANQRASNAQAIHAAGFSGTPLGGLMGNSTEAALLRNRFDNNLGLEVERQNSMRQGANMAMDYADRTNKFASDQVALNQEKLTNAGNNFASVILSNPQYKDVLNSNNPNAVANLYNSDPVFKKAVDDLWASNGGQGSPNAEWMAGQGRGVLNGADTGLQTRNAVESILRQTNLTPEQQNLAADILMGQLSGIELYTDENGVPQVRLLNEGAHETAVNETMVQGVLSGATPIRNMNFTSTEDPTYQRILSGATQWNSDRTEVVGASAGILGFGREPGYQSYPQLETAHSNGTPINIDGRLYYVDSIDTQDGYVSPTVNMVIPGTKAYWVVDVVSGDRRYVVPGTGIVGNNQRNNNSNGNNRPNAAGV